MTTFSTTGFPKTVMLRNGARVTVRPLEPGDAERLHAFFVSLPESDRQFMKDDVLDAELARRWAENGDRSRSVALLAVEGDRVLADAALLRHRGPARGHQAEVRINILPQAQGNGLGTILLRELAEIAWDADIEMLEFELVEGFQDAAIETVSGIGAYHVATLNDYLSDAEGTPCGLAFYRLPLSAWFKF